MTTLTQTAYYTRKAIKLGVIFSIAFLILKFSVSTANKLWRKLHPPPPPPPTVTFGKLPKINFGEESNQPSLSFRLETIEGGLPQLASVGRVYFMPKKEPGFLDLERAKQKARLMGFVGQPEAVSNSLYRWQTETEPKTTLEMNINTGNFTLRYPYREDQSLLSKKILPTNEQAAAEVKKFLQTNGYLSDDLANGRAEFAYLRLEGGNLVPAISLSEADFIRVNLFRADLDGMKILPPNPRESLISFLFSGARERGKQIVEINYTYFPIERETFATYPLKAVQAAWQELQGGEGYIANLGENSDGKITIRKVYLAYFESAAEQNFLQPIFVFEGDRHFFGYVAAVSPEWTE